MLVFVLVLVVGDGGNSGDVPSGCQCQWWADRRPNTGCRTETGLTISDISSVSVALEATPPPPARHISQYRCLTNMEACSQPQCNAPQSPPTGRRTRTSVLIAKVKQIPRYELRRKKKVRKTQNVGRSGLVNINLNILQFNDSGCLRMCFNGYFVVFPVCTE